MNTLFLLLTYLQDVSMADSFRSEGKIYVVVAVFVLILVIFFAYLIRTDSKLKKLEDKIQDQDSALRG